MGFEWMLTSLRSRTRIIGCTKVESLAASIGDLLKHWSVPTPKNEVSHLWQCDIDQAKGLLEEWRKQKGLPWIECMARNMQELAAYGCTEITVVSVLTIVQEHG